MSIRVLVETLVHLETFRNIDLGQQGIYYIKLCLYYIKGNSKIMAHPLTNYESKNELARKRRQVGKHNYHSAIPPHILHEEHIFCSKAFAIRYCEEEIEVNDIVEFRAEIDVEPDYLNTPFVLETELMFGELGPIGGADKLIQNLKRLGELIEFKSLCKRKFNIQMLPQSIFQFIPIVFKDPHFALLNTMIHSAILDFRFRLCPLQIHPLEESKEAKTPTNINNKEVEFVHKKGVLGEMTNNPRSLAQCLFEGGNGKIENLTEKEVRALYGSYMGVLVATYDRFTQKLQLLQNKCLSDTEKLNNAELLGIPELIIPESESEGEMFSSPKRNVRSMQSVVESKYKNSGIAVGGKENLMEEWDDQQFRHALDGDSSICNISQDISRLENYQDMVNDFGGKPLEESQESIDPEESMNEMDEHEDPRKAIPVLKSNKKSINQLNNQVKTHLNFPLKITLEDPYFFANHIMINLSLVGGQLFQIWHKYIELLTISPTFVSFLMNTEYKVSLAHRFGECIYRKANYVRNHDFTQHQTENVAALHMQIAKLRRQNNDHLYDTKIPFLIEDEEIFGQKESHPILFEELYINSGTGEENKIEKESGHGTGIMENAQTLLVSNNFEGIHLFVLVHGFQGNAYDMRLLKNNLSLLYPEALFLCSSSNENETEGDIMSMGVRLAQEILQYINEWCPSNTLGKISFIGHSLGGIIIRSALPYLQDYSSKMKTFMSFSSHHLGFMYNSSTIIDAGIWFLKKWKKSKSLKQLTMSDARRYEDTFIYKLSKNGCLGWFKHVILIGSHQDQYAPFDSARIEISPKALSETGKGDIYVQMAKNLLSSIKAEALYRIDVNFVIPEKNLDSFIGRTAHILFLECDVLMKMLIHRYSEFFE